jgi:hypothetical protein
MGESSRRSYLEREARAMEAGDDETVNTVEVSGKAS